MVGAHLRLHDQVTLAVEVYAVLVLPGVMREVPLVGVQGSPLELVGEDERPSGLHRVEFGEMLDLERHLPALLLDGRDKRREVVHRNAAVLPRLRGNLPADGGGAGERCGQHPRVSAHRRVGKRGYLNRPAADAVEVEPEVGRQYAARHAEDRDLGAALGKRQLDRPDGLHRPYRDFSE